MRKGVTKVGNSYGVILDKAILELLKIGPETELELSTDGKSLTITPVVTAAESSPTYGRTDTEAVREAAREVVEIYADTFRKLAE